MRRCLFAVIVLLLTLPSDGSCEDDGWRPSVWQEDMSLTEQPPSQCRERRVALVGDSLLKGKWFTGYFHDLHIQYEWYEWDPDYLSDADIIVHNFSEVGAQSSEIRETLRAALRTFHPTHVVIYSGVNDCASPWYPPYINAMAVTDEIDRMVRMVRRGGAYPIVVQHYPWKGSRYDRKGKGWECSAIVNEWIEGEDFAPDGADRVNTIGLGSCDGMRGAERECACDDVECEDKFALDPDFDSGDGLHPNRIGQAVLADIIQSQVFW